MAPDVAVVGAGPAGLAAAIVAADAGLSVAVLDLADRAGGQIHRHAAPGLGGGKPSPAFARTLARFTAHERAGRIAHLPRHAVWSVSPADGGFVVRALEDERERLDRTVPAAALVVATGAHDRHVPFPGWTLPGVMAAGGAQALLKGCGVPPGRRAVVAGTGPFLLSVADGLLAAGVEVAAVVEANAPSAWARHARAVAGARAKVPEALRYAASLARRRVPVRARHAVVAAHGDDRLRAVTIARVDADWRAVPGGERRVACDVLAVGYGFVPQVELLLELGCEWRLGADGTAIAVVDADGRTSVAGVYAAGETTGVGGADLATAEGALAGAAVSRALGATALIDARALARLRARRDRLRAFAAAMHAVHPVRDGWTTWLGDDTLVCRCEEVPCAAIRAAVCDLGAADARTVKLLARPGMGWCQGRICGLPTAALTASLLGRPVAAGDVEGLGRRALAQPVPLGVLAQLDHRSG